MAGDGGGGAPFRVVLVGRRIEHNENLGLGYLRAALDAAGLPHETHYLNDARDVVRIARALAERPPPLLGLSLADGGSSFLPLALGELLERHGYRGRVVCGGQWATLARDWLLERYGWIDGVVRFAGEVPLVDVAQRVRAGRSIEGVPGLTTRASGDGAPAPVLDETAMRLLPVHEELPEILGHPAAHLAGSRGCEGRCHYCGPAALHTLERREGQRAGETLPVLRRAGVGGVRRRDVDDVCDEMAELWHDRGVRYFYFVDEHLLPYREQDALAYLDRFSAGLRARGVGRLGIGCMLRADRLTPAIAEAFVSVGLVRAFVGLEVASKDEGRRFGRPARTEHALSMIRAFGERGVATVCNMMLLHPYSTLETIEGGVELLERLPAGVFEATRMLVYHGTTLQDRMRDEGRLVGNPLRYGYTFEEPALERFAEVFSRLRAEAFYDYSMACRTHDAHLALALARRLHPERVRPPVEQRLEQARCGLQRLYVDGYRSALELARAGGGYAEAGPLLERMRRRAVFVESELDEVEQRLHEGGAGRRAFAPMRAAAAGVISFCMLGTGCPGSHETAEDAAIEAGTDGGGDGGEDAATCGPPEREAAHIEVARLASEATDGCFQGSVADDSAGGVTARLQLPFHGGFELMPCPTSGRAAVEALESRVEEAVEADRPACFDATSVEGGVATDIDRMRSTLLAECPEIERDSRGIEIVLDESGAVTEVRSETGTEALAACIASALDGLSFPCLASFEVCPEFVIVE